ncbi:MetQ/NlpA family ABC transporter substrate-binding protein [Neomicrococcus lactis]|uniref:MetQ/NlpA family ABC transporter substrate-binding protein n=1 Tax=Neomicrococcus lactis TaxID=732241 RepID=UPI0022FFE056|nr:MetQ/NlpA family ABC transporter substrate-binding protein [Neomicrococcus lactis]
MRNKLILSLASIAAAVSLTACGASGTASNSSTAAGSASSGGVTVVKVGANPVPHAKILEFVDQNLAKEAGIDLDIKEFDDYQTPNIALSEGSVDANYFMHEPFFNDQVKTKGYKFEHGTGVHIEPYAGFSEKYKTVEEIPDGATIGITNDPGNQPRALKMLEAAGLLKDIADDSAALTLTDAQNPKKFKFEENQPEILVQVAKDPKIDLAIINGNYILQAGMSTKDALIVESTENNPYANFLAWRTGEQSEGVKKLDELLHSDEVKKYIEDTWPSGDVIPAS